MTRERPIPILACNDTPVRLREPLPEVQGIARKSGSRFCANSDATTKAWSVATDPKIGLDPLPHPSFRAAPIGRTARSALCLLGCEALHHQRIARG